MKKKLFFSGQVVLFGLFVFSLLATVLQFFGNSNSLTRFDHSKPVYNNLEAYDPSLFRLNSLERLEEYCDSIYAENVFADKGNEFEKTYVDIVSNTIRNRFYHGYSYSGFSDNYVGELISRVSLPGLSALVAPDDILKYPYAACSQQAIVMMETLKDKGFKTRKVTFDNIGHGGHFAFEVFSDGKWHFHDPNMEPDKKVLEAYERPDINFLVSNPEILLQAYNRYPKEQILGIFASHSYGAINKFPAPRAIVFQKVTKFLSSAIWLFFLAAFFIVRRKYLKLSGKIRTQNSDISVARMQPETVSVYYPPAQG
ncbi:MAG TPA: hypothetical protein VI461_05585 [Chitinophagaceae bacterium]|nr:hypothetical protein [Chitinophagaceae bacterium]